MKCFQLALNVFCADQSFLSFLPLDPENWLGYLLIKINICDIARTLICAKICVTPLGHQGKHVNLINGEIYSHKRKNHDVFAQRKCIFFQWV